MMAEREYGMGGSGRPVNDPSILREVQRIREMPLERRRREIGSRCAKAFLHVERGAPPRVAKQLLHDNALLITALREREVRVW